MLEGLFGRGHLIGVGALAWTVLSGGGCTPQSETPARRANPNWELAWKTARTIPSPIDAGLVKAQICQMAALSGQTGLLEQWRAEEQVPWVKVSCDSARAYAAAIWGTPENHDALLQSAVTAAKQIDEWDQMRITTPLARAHIAGLWQRSHDLEAMTQWILADEAQRMPVAAQFFCDWLTLQRRHAKGDSTHNARVMPIVDLLMAHRQHTLPAQRMRLFAGLSPFLKGTPWEATVRQETGELEMSHSQVDCETLLIIGRIHAGLGVREKADDLINRAQALIESQETGECLAPWAELAETMAATGRSREEVARIFEAGILRSSDRPGYFKPVAEALTYAKRAQHEWLAE